jgi:hypothetical protein
MTDQNVTNEEEFDLLIEWPQQQGISKASLGENLDHLKQESQRAMNIAISVIRSMAGQIAHTMDDLDEKVRPDEMEVEFSLKLELEGGAIVPMVAKTTAGGQFNIKFKWTLDKTQHATVLVSGNK